MTNINNNSGVPVLGRRFDTVGVAGSTPVEPTNNEALSQGCGSASISLVPPKAAKNHLFQTQKGENGLNGGLAVPATVR